ncbi:MAG: hypothetical protein J6Q22_09985 [Prevotella sp.]|nr:hypothetical protein [Prevotella sp.]
MSRFRFATKKKGEKVRLWPLAILDQLPRQQLLGQHRECCALRGNGWGRKHSTVDYVFLHHPYFLVEYHKEVMREIERRGYMIRDKNWWNCSYRGKKLGYSEGMKFEVWYGFIIYPNPFDKRIYPEHDEKYLDECISNLAVKGVILNRQRAISNMAMRGELKNAG